MNARVNMKSVPSVFILPVAHFFSSKPSVLNDKLHRAEMCFQPDLMQFHIPECDCLWEAL